MKKIFPLILIPLLSLFSVSAQITQAEADSIVKERFSNNTSDFTIFAKEDVQTGFEITTATGETLELNYPCWIYYVYFNEDPDSKYLIVKESNGNLLEISTKNDEINEGQTTWRIVIHNIPFEDYSLYGTGCWWSKFEFNKVFIINSNEELSQYITCREDNNYPEIDFSKHTLLWARGGTPSNVHTIKKQLQQILDNEYKLYIDVLLGSATIPENWIIALIINKISEDSHIELNVTLITSY